VQSGPKFCAQIKQHSFRHVLISIFHVIVEELTVTMWSCPYLLSR